jgi:hypothetical protein
MKALSPKSGWVVLLPQEHYRPGPLQSQSKLMILLLFVKTLAMLSMVLAQGSGPANGR